MNGLLLCAIVTLAIVGQYYLADAVCAPFDAQAQCPFANVDFLADPCNSTCFYTCLEVSGVYSAVQRCCQICEVWSQDLLTCIPNMNQPECVNVTSVESAVCELAEGSSKYSFILGDSEMTCAPGTLFNLTACTCVHDPEPFSAPAQEVTCITFSNGWNNLAASNGIWAASSNVEVASDCTPAGGNCGYFNSTIGSKMTIPYFSNNVFNEFSISLWFKRSAGNSGRQGLVDNGDCGGYSSIGLMSKNENFVSAFLRNERGDAFFLGSAPASDGAFHHLAIVHDGASVMVYIDGANIIAVPFSGHIKRVFHPMVIGACLCSSCNFDGYMDSISFANYAFSPADVASLASNVGLCKPEPFILTTKLEPPTTSRYID